MTGLARRKRNLALTMKLKKEDNYRYWRSECNVACSLLLLRSVKVRGPDAKRTPKSARVIIITSAKKTKRNDAWIWIWVCAWPWAEEIK
jgi:hypothetical protein